jgi:uncharacterized protein YhaN
MKITGLMIVFLLGAFAVPAQTNQGWPTCRGPVRVFPGRSTVNLTPLFNWWAHQPLVITNVPVGAGTSTNTNSLATRPLAGWYRVTGTKVGVYGASWVVNAILYTSPTSATNARIILNHPPAVEEQQFNNLEAQLTDLDQRLADTRGQYEVDTNAEAQAHALVETYRRSLSKVASDGVFVNTRTQQAKHNAAALALNQMDQLEAARRQVEDQLRTIPSDNGVYQVDWFAVLQGRSKQGVPIFDLGLVSAGP